MGNCQIQELLKTEVLEQHPGLLDLLRKFLDQHSYEKERQQSSHMAKAVGTVKNSVKTVSHAVTSMPGTLIQRVDSVVDGLSRVLQQVTLTESCLITRQYQFKL